MRFLNTTTRKVLGAVFALLLILASGGVAWMHRNTVTELENGMLSKLSGISATLGAQIDGGRVRSILNRFAKPGAIVKNTQDPYFYILHENLRTCAEANSMDLPLAILTFDQTADELITVVTSSGTPAFRMRYTGAGATDLMSYLAAKRIDVMHGMTDNALLAYSAVRDDRGMKTAVIVAVAGRDALTAVAWGKLWRNIVAAILVLVLIAALLIRSVGRWVTEEESQRAQLQERNSGITDSIAYASRLQGAMVPRAEALQEQFAEHFVLNMPKDIVSGDFHWYHRLDEDRCLVAVADCTGHGVPGAMMATLGCSLLNEVVLQDPWRDPSAMLQQLNRRLLQSLQQHGQRKGAGDGMDIALCRIDRHQREIIFAGAFRPLYWIHDGQLTVINGDRMPIGGSHFDPERRFTAHRIAYHPGDRIYLFSDGYVDQFGGSERKKFMIPRFNALLLGEQHLGLHDQCDLLSRAFNEWRGDQEQLDDVCVMGLQMRA